MVNKKKILIVDDEIAIRLLLQERLNELGYITFAAGNGLKALELVDKELPDLVLTDILMNPIDGLELLKRIKNEHPEIVVVVFTAFSSEDMIIEALRSGASDYLKKPFDIARLEAGIRNAINSRDLPDRNDLDFDSLIFERKRAELPNDPRRIRGAVNMLMLSAARYLNSSRSRELAVALSEIILNAMEHGNLEITHQEKSAHLESGDYMTFLEARRADPRFAGRKVTVDYQLTNDGLFFKIEDQGAGFDWRRALQLGQEKHADLSSHGRGLLLAGFYADRLDFSESGNAVTLSVFADQKGGS